MRCAITAALGAGLLLAAAANAASVTYIGRDTSTADGWRSTNVAKPFDADNAYGSSGYVLFTDNDPWAVPGFLSVGALYESYYTYGGYNCWYDATGLGSAPTIGDVPSGMYIWWSQPNTGAWYDLFKLTLTESQSFGVAVLANAIGIDDFGYNPGALKVYRSGGGESSGVVSANYNTTPYPERWSPEYYLFNITGNAGDVFIVAGQQNPEFGYGVEVPGILFDRPYQAAAVPLPSALGSGLVLLGGCTLVQLRRRWKA